MTRGELPRFPATEDAAGDDVVAEVEALLAAGENAELAAVVFVMAEEEDDEETTEEPPQTDGSTSMCGGTNRGWKVRVLNVDDADLYDAEEGDLAP